MAHVAVHAGVVFWPWPDGQCQAPHPRFVISDPVDGFVITVNLTDAANHPELTCILERGEHECVHKRSAVWFQKCTEVSAANLAKALVQGTVCRQFENLSPELLKRVVAAFKADKNVRDSLKQKYGFLPAPPAPKKPF